MKALAAEYRLHFSQLNRIVRKGVSSAAVPVSDRSGRAL